MKIDENEMKRLIAILFYTTLIPSFAAANEMNNNDFIENLISDVSNTLSNSITVTTLDPINEQNQIKSSPTDLFHFAINETSDENDDVYQTVSKDENEDISEYGYNSEYAEHSIGIEITAVSDSMRTARINSIDEASKYAVNEFLRSMNLEGNSVLAERIQRNYIERVLIIDEQYNSSSKEYIGYFDIWIDTSRAQSEILGFNNSIDITDIQGPEWVLVVPAKEDDQGLWRLSDRNDIWTDTWKIPSNENNTQFVSTRGDADDRNASSNISTMDEFATFLSQKYNAQFILFTSYNQNNSSISTLLWENETQSLMRKETPIISQNNESEYNVAKNSTISLFWNTFANTGDEYSTNNSSNDDNQNSSQFIEYIIVGKPKFSGEGVMINLQIIIPQGQSWDDIEYAFRSKNKFNMVSMERGTNSVLVRAYLDGLNSKESIEFFLESIGLKPY